MRKRLHFLLRCLSVWIMVAPVLGLVVSIVNDKPILGWVIASVFVLILTVIDEQRPTPTKCKQCGMIKESDFKCIKTIDHGYETFNLDEDDRKEEVLLRKIEKVYRCPKCGHTFTLVEKEY